MSNPYAYPAKVGLPIEWPPKWFTEFRNTITPKEISYAATYAIVSFSTEKGLLEAQAILTLFSKTSERVGSMGGNPRLELIVHF